MKIELCAASMEAIKLSKKMNVDRIELCQALEQGGLTPSPGMIDYALAYGVETHVLIRPRPGGFNYSWDEIEIILRDIRECKTLGAHGVVIGALNEMGLIDQKALNLMVDHADGMEVTFHRAFDDTFEFKKSLDVLIESKVNRVLSSGLSSNVSLGMEILEAMKNYASGRIEIMAGGGVNSSNIQSLIDKANPDAIHFSGTKKFLLDEESMFSETVLKVDESKVSRIIDAINKIV